MKAEKHTFKKSIAGSMIQYVGRPACQPVGMVQNGVATKSVRNQRALWGQGWETRSCENQVPQDNAFSWQWSPAEPYPGLVILPSGCNQFFPSRGTLHSFCFAGLTWVPLYNLKTLRVFIPTFLLSTLTKHEKNCLLLYTQPREVRAPAKMEVPSFLPTNTFPKKGTIQKSEK